MPTSKCILCDGSGDLQERMSRRTKKEKAFKMREFGFSVREIQRALGYKSPRSISDFFTPRKEVVQKKVHAKTCEKNECSCDGYHTFAELYDHRETLYIALCKRLRANAQDWVWRSKLHSDDTMFDGMFILGIGKEGGKQITYHLEMDRWEETKFAETLDNAPKFDGHTSDGVLIRLKEI